MALEETSIGQLMSDRLETINLSSSAQLAAKKMRDKNISSLVVTDDYNKPVGIVVTERDLVRKICVNNASSTNTQIKDIMSFPLLTINSTASVGEAANIMTQNRVIHILVIENNDISKPLGIVTPSDFAGYLKENLYIDDVNAKILLQSIQADSRKDQEEKEQ
jgi:signal-transduction protein with cAMP-binding, CBS, and nucleotidyltransferase domain